MAKFAKDEVINRYFDRLHDIKKQVFDDTKIEYIPCENIPEGLTEDVYVQIYRKQMACLRHHIYIFMKDQDRNSKDEETKEAHRKKFEEIVGRKPEFQKKAMELYGVKLRDGDTRSVDLVMREVYLDFYTKSLQPDSAGIAYSKRL